MVAAVVNVPLIPKGCVVRFSMAAPMETSPDGAGERSIPGKALCGQILRRLPQRGATHRAIRSQILHLSGSGKGGFPALVLAGRPADGARNAAQADAAAQRRR